jgi:hypothetical protein
MPRATSAAAPLTRLIRHFALIERQGLEPDSAGNAVRQRIHARGLEGPGETVASRDRLEVTCPPHGRCDDPIDARVPRSSTTAYA